jgi:hypothetical protein
MQSIYAPPTPSSGSTDPISSSGQIVNTLMLVGIILIIAIVFEMLYKTTLDARNRFYTLVDYTANSSDATITIQQDASKYSDAKPIGFSINERTGIEFGYSVFIYADPATFSGSSTFKHVFHKGYAMPWPLMGPGVFFHSDTNTLRVVMNTYKNPFTYADVKNIPVQKWFHLVLNSYKGGLDIFINGNLANRISFKDTLPYQNFQNLVLFSTINSNSLRGSGIPSLNGEDFQIEGSFKGYISNLTYARYALSMNEIQAIMSAGPSSTVKVKQMDAPPYMADDWWANSV